MDVDVLPQLFWHVSNNTNEEPQVWATNLETAIHSAQLYVAYSFFLRGIRT